MVDDKILLQINIEEGKDLKMILNKATELEQRALVNFLEQLIETMNEMLEFDLEDLKK